MSRVHLSDDRLAELCLTGPVAGAEESHLMTCERCETRRIALASTLADVTTQMIDEADQHFPAERLARQHARILQQVDQLGRPARVIAFPIGHPQQPVRVAAARPRRWLAAAGAVAAAFVVGVLTEHLVHPAPGISDSRIARTVDAGTPRTVVASLSDDELLGQIELAVGSTSPAALRALDALTPRAWDVR